MKIPSIIFDDGGDGVNEMCLLFDEDSKKGSPKGSSQKPGCGVVLLIMGASVISTGILLGKFLA